MGKKGILCLRKVCLAALAFVVCVSVLTVKEEIVWCGEAKQGFYNIGVIAPISGPGAALGKYFAQAVEVETKYINNSGGINGIPVKLFIEDDQSNPTVALVAVKKLIQNGAVCILGSVLTNNVLAMIPELEKAQVPNIASGAGRQIIDPLRKWIFKVPHTDTKVNLAMLEFAKRSLEAKQIAVLFQDDAYGMSGAKQMRTQAPQLGISIVSEQTFHAGDSNMISQLMKISKKSPDAVLVHSFIGPGAIIAKNAYQIGLKTPIVYSTGAVSETLIKVAGNKVAEGLYFAGIKPTIGNLLPQNDPQKFFYDRFLKRLKKENIRFDTFHGNGHDATNLMAYALKKISPKVNDTRAIRDAIQRALETVKNLPLHNAMYTFTSKDHDGAMAESLVMVQVRDGKFVPAK
ncbi:MAG: ABC transporter substrate-binding protein [Deltaproteobacteria bacterium]|nr:ABC transporter substrate-binding protein [Deltaproteobacteria bacterium]MBW2333512.1 ABC transporter substrate-binding protein [Deltaproteobacteria bacterium]